MVTSHGNNQADPELGFSSDPNAATAEPTSTKISTTSAITTTTGQTNHENVNGQQREPQTEQEVASWSWAMSGHIRSLDIWHNVQVFELDALGNWEMVPVQPRLPLKVKGMSELEKSRMYLVEGVSEQTLRDFPEIDGAFWSQHISNVLLHGQGHAGSQDLFAKWTRHVYQTTAQWNIDERIKRGTPWNLDMLTNPRDVGIEHTSYFPLASVPRPRDPLEASSNFHQSKLRKGLTTCVSFRYWQTGLNFVGNTSILTKTLAFPNLRAPRTLGV